MKADGKLATYLHFLKQTLTRGAPAVDLSVAIGSSADSSVAEEMLVRSDIFSAVQMEKHARYLAQTHRVAKQQAPDHLRARLDANEKVLLGVRALLTRSIAEKRQVTPAGEWLLDNFYLIAVVSG